MKIPLYLALFILTLGAPLNAGYCAVRPGLGDAPRREVVDVHHAPWWILGRVQTSLGSRCTGFAVAPSVVMTAAHCLWLPATGRFIQPQDVHFLAEYQRGSYSVHAQAVRVIISAGYDPFQEAASASLDRATLILDRPVIEASRLLPTFQAKKGEASMLAGYQQDRAEVVFADTHCHVLAPAQGGLIRHNCEGTHGVSGAPLLVRNRNVWGIGGIAILAGSGAGGLAVSLPQ
ncbi:trypsin-like serine peptidase [Gluconobacter wancherniae]|uniref:Peptidase S1 domain-containing protein n=1 Tax=Gluconobacter wancherniae NBRC 103581 TaxID=656744 RepID=A0A511B037_9PROT|nr:trypsin-like serine protease [Gluconobacter wancherniae]MBF0852995.1 trypsin-like serine protease [Gluconobacter wancherniae]GBD56288.1 peptidase S1 [Gluconobacter wancherniae NBRC 103581]GBR63564.1 peptidase S1/S6 [Gluconobacter wancherniae NBRC 103581]GEK92811.1 hypothetical protein GWA01_05810 [Gluconobacter wancherniae NBRC 103581]